jgi:hypothetical protein
MRARVVLVLAVAASVAPAAVRIDRQTALLDQAGWDALAEGHARRAGR